MISFRSSLVIAFFLATLATSLVWVLRPDLVTELQSALTHDALQDLVARSGYWGPVLVVALMTLAVVLSPIPSAPIALAAGAAYGHTTGTILIVVGAESGALIAFFLARVLGRDMLKRWFGDRIDIGLLGSQNALSATVLVSRLLPFVSFDLISYAAGLSCLKTWRFALATLTGIIPASFLLAHFGGEAATADMVGASWIVLLLGLVTGLPLVWAAVRSRKSRS
jgi:uncharacterized membrane protein YdjX (TVP38/TMEM64 family)